MIGGFGGGTETRGTLHSLLLRSLRARDPFLLRWRLSSFGPLSFCFVGCHFVPCFESCRCGCTWILVPSQITQMSKGTKWNVIYPLCTWVHLGLMVTFLFVHCWCLISWEFPKEYDTCFYGSQAVSLAVVAWKPWQTMVWCRFWWLGRTHVSVGEQTTIDPTCLKCTVTHHVALTEKTTYWFVFRSNFQALLVLDTDGGRLAVKYNSLARKDRT